MASTANTSSAATTAPSSSELVLPQAQTLLQAAKLAIEQDKPIQMDYYLATAQKKAFLGEDENTTEKMLVKSSEEYTSLVQKVYKVSTDFLVLTENSIYIVNGNLQKRKIQASNYLQGESM
jgi:hypothetical protein